MRKSVFTQPPTMKTFRRALTVSGVRTLLPALAISLSGTAVLAQQQEGRAIKVGESDVIPEVRIDYVSDSNAFLDASDELETTGVIVSPEIEWRAEQRQLLLSGAYRGSYASFSEDALNYDDHLLSFAVDSQLSSRNRLGFDLSIANRHEALGTNETRGLGRDFDEPSESTTFSVGADYTFGARSARGNITTGLLVQNTSYSESIGLDDPDGTPGRDINEGDDFSRIRPSAIFSLRVSPDTRLLAELRYAVLDFENDSRDRDEFTLLGGVAFQGTSKFGGSAKVGGTLASFSQENLDDRTELVADVNVFFLPRTYSRLSLTFSREFDDQPSNVIDTQSTRDTGNFSWRHDWSTRFNTIAFAALSNLDRECDNDQLTTTVGLELNVAPRRWLELGVSGSTSERMGTSNNCELVLLDSAGQPASISAEDAFDYERLIVGAHVRVTL